MNGNSSLGVTLSWNQPVCDYVNLSDLLVARWDGSMWRDYGNGGTTGSITGGTVTSSTSVSSFSPFAVGSSSPSTPLPYILADFVAIPRNISVKTEWEMTMENNISKYIVERSADREHFENAGEVFSEGNTENPRSYSFDDHNPLAGQSWYRLRILSKNGNENYSEIVSVNMNESGTPQMFIYPNPIAAGQELVVAVKGIQENSEFTLQILDAQGKLIYSQNKNDIREMNRFEFDMSKISAGVYFVQLKSGNVFVTKSLVVSR